MHELEVAFADAYVQIVCEELTDAEAVERAEVVVAINEARGARGLPQMIGNAPLRMSTAALRQVLLADIAAVTPVAA